MKYSRMTAGSLAVVATVLSIAPAYADLDDPLFKLLPNDGVVNDEFGYSVAISGTRAIVGVPLDDDNGFNSGSAYIFDTITGQQLFKLLPNDGASGDVFGLSVAISGTRAIVGAWQNDDDGNASGSAYIFDATTGQQLFKLLANDAAEGDAFGHSVAISGTRAIVAAWFDDDNGNQSGSAYLFDTTTGQQIGSKLLASDGATGDLFGISVAIDGTRAIVGADSVSKFTGSAYLFDTTTGQQIGNPLLANDGAEDDRFGTSVAISGTRAIVGAHKNDDNGSSSGSAYLFDTTTGQQIGNPLLANDAAAGDRFGISVAISSVTAIVGAYRDDDNGGGSGSAYLFDATTGQQIAKLLPSDGAASDEFGWSVAISDVRVIVGAYRDDDNGDQSGSAYITATDTDGDGLLDSWENNGIPYFDGGGSLQHFLLPGADPMHKDLYVEVDLDISQAFPLASRQLVIDAFAQSPVSNPDGFSGVNLHILYDEDLISAAFFTTFTSGPTVGWAVEFDGLKAAHFGTPAERAVGDPAALLEAKAKAYRYCIFADQIDDGSLGTAELPGNDLFLTLGQLSSPPGDTKTATVFMHEFGHTLGLGHGGSDNTNGKTNYISIMNYVHVFPQAFSTAFWKLDYSRFQLPTLDESNLDETVGINPSNAFYANVFAPHGYDMPDGSGGFTRRPILISLAPANAIDWNKNGSFTDTSVMQDLNYVGAGSPFFGIANPSFPQQLDGHDDWSNLEYGIGTSGDFADLIHTSTPSDKPSQAMIDWINANIPLPPVVCLADTNGDSMVNVTDLLTLLGGWGPNPGHVADINSDGNVNVTDLLALLAAWGACP